MKELSKEEKAKRYDESLGKARRYYDEYKTRDNILYVEDMEDIFPELKESKDERIRKTLIKHFEEKLQNGYEWAGIPVNSILTWLEKQGEHKDVADESLGKKIDIYFSEHPYLKEWYKENPLAFDGAARYFIAEGRLSTLRKQKPVERSEEDEAMIMTIINRLELGKTNTQEIPYIDKCISWLKSLRPQKQWKQSEEQMKELYNVCIDKPYSSEVLGTLYNDLKTL